MDRLLLILFFITPALPLMANEPSDGEKLFALEVWPLFAEKCLACHGDEPEKLKGDLDMRTRETILQGGETFGDEVLIPGKGDKSFLYITTTRTEEDYEMPPKEADKLSAAQQGWIRDWISAGAPWPDDKRVKAIQEKYAEGEQVATSKALSEDWQNRRYDSAKLWGYRPLKVEAVPEGRHPVDHFIDRQLADMKLNPAPAAGAVALARRMSFNFTGLPPAPKQVQGFTAAYEMDAAKAVAEYAEQLMASPHYGERFGAHWLDVARYADSAGFANDWARPNAWRYRDYVVRAFNDDKPYQDFVKEQIAGDEIDATQAEQVIATGFLRMGAWEQTSMSVFKKTRQLWLDDVTDSVGQTFLGHAMQCAKCHDHKFDPVPTRDYYRMMAVFSTTQFAERDTPFLETENRDGFARSDQWVKAKVGAYNRQLKELKARMAKMKKQETGEAKVGDNGLDPGAEASLARMNKNVQRHQLEMDRTRPIALAVFTGNTVPVNQVKGRSNMPKNPWDKGHMEQDTILGGGDAYSPSKPVTPGALSAAESLSEMTPSAFPAGQHPRRLALAEWIVDKQNPLTARVMVNRIWAWHFGKGLAANPNNLGGTGAQPTHPALLDYLAHEFMETGWSVKQLNRLIVSSQAYRRSTIHPNPKQQMKADPKQERYASYLPRRLTAEELRDSMLATSGELNRQLGGIPARPDINLEVAFQPRQIMGGSASVYEPDPLPQQRNRRSLYAEKMRGLRDPFLEAFNQPGPDKSCELRETSTIAPQALTLFNSEEVHERALGLAIRLRKEQHNDKLTIRRAFMLTLNRAPSPTESAACLAHWQQTTKEEAGIKPVAKVWPKKLDRTVMAEKTGELYTFEEFMPAYDTYVPDSQPADVDARTRGLAQVCLALFNCNEFVYLD